METNIITDKEFNEEFSDIRVYPEPVGIDEINEEEFKERWVNWD